MGSAKYLSDYQSESREDQPSGNNRFVKGGKKPYRSNSNSNVGEHYSQNIGGAYQGIRQSNL